MNEGVCLKEVSTLEKCPFKGGVHSVEMSA